MDKLIDTLYNSDLKWQSCTKDPEYREAFEALLKLENRITKRLRPRDRHVVEKPLDVEDELDDQSERTAFSNGIRFGMQLVFEVFSKSEKPDWR